MAVPLPVVCARAVALLCNFEVPIRFARAMLGCSFTSVLSPAADSSVSAMTDGMDGCLLGR